MNRTPGGLAANIRRSPRWLVVGGTLATFALTFLYRFLSAEFANDHFMHLAEGRQVLYGEWPVRDFFDFGLPLQVLTSSVTLLWSGYNLYGEALVTCAFIAAGTALTFALSARLSQSLWIATAAAVLTALAAPRLYNYPKAFWYVCALWAAWRYAQRPEARRLVLFAVVVALAFLYRHDHGVYIAISALPIFVVTHWTEPRAGLVAFARWGVVGILVVAPFLIFVQATIGLRWYLEDLVPGAQTSISPRFNALPIVFDRSVPLIVVDPPAERRISVRWKAGLDPTMRAELERKYRLSGPIADKSANTWNYVADDESTTTIRALVNDPVVEDTNGIDRGAAQLAVRELWYEWLQRRIGLLRTHILPGLFSPANALPVFYYVTVAIPLLGVVALVRTLWQGSLTRPERALASMSVLMSLVVVETLVRGSPDSRLPDVAGAVAVTGAFTVSRFIRSQGGVHRVRAVLALVFCAVMIWTVGTYSSAGQALNATRLLTGPAGIAWRFGQMRQRLLKPPIDSSGSDETGYFGLARYAQDCTRPDDRLLVTWFEPAIYFYADRSFGGRHVFFDGGWHDSPRDQQATIDRLRGQSVPLVFVRDTFELMYRKDFALVAAYVDANYVRVPPTAHVEQIAGYQVWVAKTRTSVGTYERLGLPCFR